MLAPGRKWANYDENTFPHLISEPRDVYHLQRRRMVSANENWVFFGTIPRGVVVAGCKLLEMGYKSFNAILPNGETIGVDDNNGGSEFISGHEIIVTEVSPIRREDGCVRSNMNIGMLTVDGQVLEVNCPTDADIDCDLYSPIDLLNASEASERRRIGGINDADPESNLYYGDDSNQGCFSGAATVDVEGKGLTAMRDLRIGDRVLSLPAGGNTLEYQDVYFFGHKLPDDDSAYMNVMYGVDDQQLSKLTLTGNHYARVCVANCDAAGIADGSFELEHVPAQNLKLGDLIVGVNSLNSSLFIGPIRDIYHTVEQGVYAPFVRGADLVVDGTVVSPHAQFLLEYEILYGYLPAIYEAMVLPLYLMYVVFGKDMVIESSKMMHLDQGPTPENWYHASNFIGGYYACHLLFTGPAMSYLDGAKRAYAQTKRPTAVLPYAGVLALYVATGFLSMWLGRDE